MTNLTQVAKWAESLGISRQQGYAAVKRCGITVTDGLVDSEYATMLYHRHTRPRANGKRNLNDKADDGAGSDSPSQNAALYDTSRAKREAAEASIAEMKEAKLRGEYLVKAEVDAAIFEVARAMRDGLANCAKRIAADVAALSTSDECEKIIDREHRALLDNMSQRIAAKLAPSMEMDK